MKWCPKIDKSLKEFHYKRNREKGLVGVVRGGLFAPSFPSSLGRETP